MQKLIVLAGKSVANTPAGADQSRLNEANFDIATVGGNQMISTGRLDEIDKVQPDGDAPMQQEAAGGRQDRDRDNSGSEEEDDGENSRSLVRIGGRKAPEGDKQQDEDEDDEDDDDDVDMNDDDEDEVVQRRINEQKKQTKADDDVEM